MITQCELKEVLEYNHDTGVFIRVKSNSPSVKVGDVAGAYDYKGYIVIKINYKLYKAHRLAWLYMRGKFPEKCIDHINRIRDDNRWINLRQATAFQNATNSLSKNTSGYRGAYYKKKNKKWESKIRHMNKVIYLGLYTTPQEAAEAYKKKSIELFGEFSYTE